MKFLCGEVASIRPAFITLLALLTVPVPAFSQEEDEQAEYFQALNEVFQTALVYPQEAGEVQLTIWPSFAAGADAKLSSLGLSLEYGITDAFTVEKELTEGFVEFEPYVSLARDFPEANHLQLFTQVSPGLVSRAKDSADPLDREPAAHEFSWSGGFFVAFEKVRFTGEFSLSSNKWNNGRQESSMFVTPGIFVDSPGSWEAGVGAPIGLSEDSDD